MSMADIRYGRDGQWASRMDTALGMQWDDGNPEKKRLICRIVIQKQCIGWEKGGDWSLAMIGML
jgi:hypothetical protein